MCSRGCVYPNSVPRLSNSVPRLSLEPGNHGRLSVAASTDAIYHRGAYVANARLRPLDGGPVQLVRMFGSTEQEALDALRNAIAERIGTVTEPSTPFGEPVTERASDADRLIISAREGMRAFTAQVYASSRFVGASSEAAEDRRVSGSDIVPITVVDGYVSAIVDHLQAWVDKTGGHEGEPQLWLSLYSDYTIFRPVLESLAAAIWILGPDTSEERIRNATKLLVTEHARAKQFAERMRRASRPDTHSEKVNSGLERVIREVCGRMGFHESSMFSATVDPSSLPNKASRFIPGSDGKFYRLWAICSAHAHAQLFTVMRHAARSEGTGPNGAWTYVEADSDAFAEVVEFTADALNVLVTLLNQRGHVLDRQSGPRPGIGES